MQKNIPLKEIIEFLKSEIITIHGNPEGIVVNKLSDPQNVDETTLDWISDRRDDKQTLAENSKAKSILVTSEVKYTENIMHQGKVLVVLANPKMAIAKVGNKFFVAKPTPQIHKTATIHPNAVIGKNVFIGANASIGECIIGDNCIIHSNVVIYGKTKIGNSVKIHSGAIICVEGLGCIREDNAQLVEFPQLGGVIIEDNVYIGANTHIASGSLSDTFIGRGCKINGMSFVGSNCYLGENVWITGGSMIAGSVIVGENTTIYSKAVIRDQIRIGKNATIGMGAVVTKNIPDNKICIGNPAQIIEQ